MTIDHLHYYCYYYYHNDDLSSFIGGLDWAKTTAPFGYWGSIACDKEGENFVAVQYPGYIYISASGKY